MSAIKTISKQFDLHTRLFNNVLEGISDNQGSERLNDQVNHLQWIAGHLTNSRYNFAPMLGVNSKFPYVDLYTDATKPPPNNKPLDTSAKYPSLTEIKKYWNDLAAPFIASVSNMSDEQLSSPIPFAVPIGGNSVLDLIAFLASHESYHIGQMGILRKYLGKDAMSYK